VIFKSRPGNKTLRRGEAARSAPGRNAYSGKRDKSSLDLQAFEANLSKVERFCSNP